MRTLGPMTVFTIVMALAGCHESSTSIVTDGGSDASDTTPTDTGTDPTIPPCEDLSDWDIQAEVASSAAGTVTVRVDLQSAGMSPGCAGSPCLVVTVAAGDGSVSGITQVSASRITFVYSDTSTSTGDEAQLLLRWRVLCDDGGTDEERTVTSPVWICTGSGGILTLSEGPC